MNIILLHKHELNKYLAPNDFRSIHIKEILQARANDILQAGVINESLGTLRIIAWHDSGLEFDFCPAAETTDKARLQLDIILGMLRPATMRRMIRDLASLGLRNIYFCNCQLSEGAYSKSKVWRELSQLTMLGAQQAKLNRLPTVRRFDSLQSLLAELNTAHYNSKILLDCGTNNASMLLNFQPKEPLILALGSERGWTDHERELFARDNFQLASLGLNILRSELAAHIAVGMLCQNLEALRLQE